MKLEGLSAARVASVTKKENGLAEHFLERFIKFLNSRSDEWLYTICWSSLSKKCIVFSLTCFGNSQYECVINTREMLSFIALINYSIIAELSFLLLNISAIISSKTINFLSFLFGYYLSNFL